MIQIICKSESYTYNAYHILKAFYPSQEVSCKTDEEASNYVMVQLPDGQEIFAETENLQTEKKRQTDLNLYDQLEKITGEPLAWGVLTGVRPTKLAMQKLEASLVAGYKAWQKNFERHVNKGEKAIRILAPAPYKIKEERDKIDPVTQEIMIDRDGNPQKEKVEITIPAFRAVPVFNVSKTDGKPIPELEAKELLSDVKGYQDMIHAVKLFLRFRLRWKNRRRIERIF